MKSKRGDTLSRISSKFYKNRKYYKIIYQANQDQMKSENDLKVGQILRIPIPKNR
jgi:nucleoid-associated protein YgaU